MPKALSLWSLFVLSIYATALPDRIAPKIANERQWTEERQLSMKRAPIDIPEIPEVTDPAPEPPVVPHQPDTPDTELGGPGHDTPSSGSSPDPFNPSLAPNEAPSEESEGKEAVEDALDTVKEIIDKINDAIQNSQNGAPSSCNPPASVYLPYYQTFTSSCAPNYALDCPDAALQTASLSLNNTWAQCRNSTTAACNSNTDIGNIIQCPSFSDSGCQNNVTAACNSIRKYASQNCNIDLPACESPSGSSNGSNATAPRATPTPTSSSVSGANHLAVGFWSIATTLMLFLPLSL
ncbi:hypothetical protein NA57DRAFT_60974 [Rhizodiscina lignyota]|uniref:Uncharacterized protein n=1 Tax=Rhizodiscina lignyota TaxID=1504668 RepID=A0A9P4I2F8_9PEZI|nr:hypothetical protein NA57DRAFT_60974 [Rhizodiscina lignyota]